MDNAIRLSGEDHVRKKKITSSKALWLKSDYVQTLQETTVPGGKECKCGNGAACVARSCRVLWNVYVNVEFTSKLCPFDVSQT